MVRSSDFDVVKLQLTAFTPHSSQFNASTFLTHVLGKHKARYSGNLRVMPLPPEVSAQVPHVELGSASDGWVLHGSPGRIDSYWYAVDSTPPLSEIVVDCASPLLDYLTEVKPRLGRFGFVINRACKTDHPAAELVNRFCSEAARNPDSPEAPLRNSRSFQIHNLKRYSSPIDGIEINSWVRCLAGPAGDEEAGIVVEQDINTPQEELGARAFSIEEAASFFPMALGEAQSVLSKYFPE